MDVNIIFNEIKNKGWINFCIDNKIIMTQCKNSLIQFESININENKKELYEYYGKSNISSEVLKKINFNYNMILKFSDQLNCNIILNFGTKAENTLREENNNNNNNNNEYKELNVLIDVNNFNDINKIISENILKYKYHYKSNKCFSLIWFPNSIKKINEIICIIIEESIDNNLYFFLTKQIQIKYNNGINILDEIDLNDINIKAINYNELNKDNINTLKKYKFKNIPLIISRNKNNKIYCSFLICLPGFNFLNDKIILYEE
jgi:hypothetical protein